MLIYHRPQQNIIISPVITLLAILAALPVLFHFNFVLTYTSFYYLAFIIAAASLAITGMNLNHREVTCLLYVFIASAYIWAISGLIVWFDLNNNGSLLAFGNWALTTTRNVKINGPFSNGNIFAIMIFMAWLICLWFWIKQKNKIPTFWFFSMLFFWIVAFLSSAKAAYLSHLLPLGIICFYCLKRKFYFKILILFISAISSFILASELNNTINADKSLQTPPKISSQIEHLQESSVRPLLYASIYEIWRHNPYIGVGYGNIKAHYLTAQAQAFDKYKFNTFGLDLTLQAHNIILHLMAEAGLIGIIASIIISWLLIKLLISSWKGVTLDMWPITMMLIMLWLQGMLNITLTRPFPILLFSLFLGISLNYITIKKIELKIDSIRYIAPSLIIPALLLLILAYSNTYNWTNYEKWLTASDNSEIKKSLIPPLLNNANTMPLVVAETARKSIMRGTQSITASLQPNIRKALGIEESQTLYQALFFSQIYSGQFTDACKTGKFIQRQHWKGDRNVSFYQHACEEVSINLP